MDDDAFAAFESFDFESNSSFQRGWSSLKPLFVSDVKAMEREYLRAKAFFFSKYIQSFDFKKYKAWKSENKSLLQKATPEDIESGGKNPKGDGGDSYSSVDKEDSRTTNRDSDVAPDPHLQEEVKGSKHSSPLSAGHFSKESNETLQDKVENQCSGENSSDVDGNKSSQITATKLEKDKNEIDNETEKEEDYLSLAELAMLVQNGLPIPGLISVDVQPTNKEPTPSAMSRKPKPWEMNKNEENIVEKENQVEACSRE